MMPRNNWLIVGGWLSLAASALHLACIVGGPDWYRFFGAGEELATMAEQGSMVPAAITFVIAVVLAVWGAYAFAGAGVIRRLPLMRTALVAITTVYMVRGLMIVPLQFQPRATAFDHISSLIVLGYGLIYLIGTRRAWPVLARKESVA